MTNDTVAYSQSRHPAPHRGEVRLATLFYGMFVAPIVWVGNLIVTYALVSHACYPDFRPLDQPVEGFGFVWGAVVAFYFASLLICASGFVVSYLAWRKTGGEGSGRTHQLLKSGEGRTRYLALNGMAFSVLFFSAVLFGAPVPFMVPLCVH